VFAQNHTIRLNIAMLCIVMTEHKRDDVEIE